ncbi:MAG: hypothetical protein AVDCRST_MAG89-2862 [uncultured Gemmatimonadetes bacterium]|uniref:Uncharacterized protein n=1 Tax=uncultured Gemmatimonadota bacterium TaxID=203437 RepID=A0A6J4LZW3_9BACT|nr:MAG: hypothetical protein AVDCRST_MAG89-2862 [uncultured Gemmatimonadota bacterium]
MSGAPAMEAGAPFPSPAAALTFSPRQAWISFRPSPSIP